VILDLWNESGIEAHVTTAVTVVAIVVSALNIVAGL
jgi:hypothetical protein